MAAGSSTGNRQGLSPGSRVSCTICTGEKIDGEVVAYDAQNNVLVLELPSSSGEKGMCNINFLNTELLKEFKVLEEAKKSPRQLPALDLCKIAQRTEKNLSQRKKQVERIGIGVSVMAQKLFDLISKTYNCRWDGQDILVQDADVRIKPPYKLENVHGDPPATDRITKLVEKFHTEQAKTQ